MDAKEIHMDEDSIHKENFSIHLDYVSIHLAEKVILMDESNIHKDNLLIHVDEPFIRNFGSLHQPPIHPFCHFPTESCTIHLPQTSEV